MPVEVPVGNIGLEASVVAVPKTAPMAAVTVLVEWSALLEVAVVAV
jgi:hypothetical protein